MVDSIQAVGRKIRCTGMESFYGQMVNATKVNMLWTKSTAKVLSFGQMAYLTQDPGSMVSDMERAGKLKALISANLFGKMANEAKKSLLNEIIHYETFQDFLIHS